MEKELREQAVRFWNSAELVYNNKDYYIILDKYFPLYRDTYSLAIEKEKCDEVRKHVSRLIKEQNLSA